MMRLECASPFAKMGDRALGDHCVVPLGDPPGVAEVHLLATLGHELIERREPMIPIAVISFWRWHGYAPDPGRLTSASYLVGRLLCADTGT